MANKTKKSLHKKRLTKKQKKILNHFKLMSSRKGLPAWELELEEYKLKHSSV